MYRRILITTDASGPSRRAAECGLRLASALGAEVTVLYVSDISEYNLLFSDEREALARDAVSEIASKGVSMGLSVSAEVVEGIAADEIIRKAAGYDAVIVGTAARSDLSRMVIGSVAENVIRRSPCPVIAMRAGIVCPEGFGRVLIATDGSEHTRPAVAHGISVASVLGSKVTALSVAEDRSPSSGFADRATCEAAVARVAEEGAAAGVEVESIVVEGTPWEVIVDMSFDHELTVMGTLGRTGIEHLRWGSVAERTVRNAGCPVMVVRSGSPSPKGGAPGSREGGIHEIKESL
ncbi:MAG: universal stress protein [Candidatus Methanomethylophilaceae archaeon]|jgi:nucleotide-binding universal stress UspA family protein|nr:universal stress protein [Candidatus Methanomethylophilaceae archaeon]